MQLEEMCDSDLVAEWNIFNDILSECESSQSEYDVDMRSEIEDEITRRGGDFEVGVRDTHVFNGFKPLEKLFVKTSISKEII